MKGKFYLLLLSLSFALASPAAAAPPGESPVATRADLNVVERVEVDQRADGAYITIHGSHKATYSVFKLQRPLRLFVDISNSQLGAGVKRAPLTVRNGIVDQVAVMDFSDDLQQVTRVIVGFENPATYDVQVMDNKIVIFVEGGAAGGGQVADANAARVQEELRQRQGELDRAKTALESKEERLADAEDKIAALEKALRDSQSGESRNVLQRALEQERGRALELRRELADRDNRIEDLQGRVEDTARQRDDAQQKAAALAQERDQARRDAEALQQRTEAARRDLAQVEGQLKGARQELANVEQERARAREEAEGLQGELKGLRQSLSTRDQEAARARQELEVLKTRLAEARRSGGGVQGLEAESEQKRKELQALEQKLAQANADIQAKERALAQREREARERDVQGERARAQAQEAQRKRDDQFARAQGSEQERLAALERARQKEQERLAALEQDRKREEAQLAEVKKSRVEEEARLEELRRQDPSLTQNALASVRQEKDQALVELKPAAGGAIVETANAIKSVRFQQKGDVSRIIIDLEKPGNFETVPWQSGKAALILKGVELPKKLERTLDTQAFGGTVRTISSFQDKDGLVKFVADVPGATTEIVHQEEEGSRLVWEFSSVGAGSGIGTAESAEGVEGENFTSAPPNYLPSARREELSTSAPPWQRRPTQMPRKRISIDLRGADVQNVLRLLAREASINIVAGEDVRGDVTMRLNNVLLADAFVTILKSLKLGYERDGEVLRVASAQSFADEAARRRKDLLDSFPLEPLEVVLLPVNYGNAQAISTLVGTVLSQRGSSSVDMRTNTIIIKDVAQNLAAAQQLILSLDTQTPQILIEGRIVETNDRFTRQLGIQWGGDFLFSPANGNPTGLVFPSIVGVAGAATDGQTPTAGLAGAPNFAVNLPAPIGTGSGGGIGFTLGSLGNGANLSLRLSALEDEGQIKIISSPKILTLDNESASISQGTSIPISVVSAAGVQTQFIEANLSLDVTPHVTQDGNILMEIRINKSEPDFENTGARGDPSILRRQANTRLLVGDGDTTVIGGIYSQTSGSGTSKVPFLGDIRSWVTSSAITARTRSGRSC
jgi:type IV pilus assembly protein PilQ